VVAVEEGLEISGGQDATTVEWIENGGGNVAGGADQEVAGECDAGQRNAGTSADLEQQARKENGNADPTLEDAIEITVLGVVVVLGVAAESVLGEDDMPDRSELPVAEIASLGVGVAGVIGVAPARGKGVTRTPDAECESLDLSVDVEGIERRVLGRCDLEQEVAQMDAWLVKRGGEGGSELGP